MDFNPDILLKELQKDLESLKGSNINMKRGEILRDTIVKKYVPSKSAPLLHVEAIKNFLELNETIKGFKLTTQFKDSELARVWRDEMYALLMTGPLQTTVTYPEILGRAYCGPGSSLGANDTSFLTKMFYSPLTTTNSFLSKMYLQTINSKWAKAEEIRQDAFGTEIVSGSRLTSVPKDASKNRTTCTEPTLNMFYQLGVKQYLESILERRLHWSHNSQPDINKCMAREASIDGRFATIDLKNASDSISVELCRFLLPKPFLDILLTIRSPKTWVEETKTHHDLHMIGTMGNGFTFHLMTLMFSALVKTLYFLNNHEAKMGYNYSVFGDDIIIKTEFVPLLYDALRNAGLTVNTEKSFTDGPFRESCGGDYFHGHNVRGCYIKRMENEADVYSIFNRLHMWALRNDICLSNVLRYIKGLAQFRPIPRHESQDSGFIITEELLTSPKHCRGSGAVIYHALKPKPCVRQVGDFYTNPDALEIAFIGGYIKDNKILLRSPKPTFVTKKCKTLNWDGTHVADFGWVDGRYRVINHVLRYMDDPEIDSRALTESWKLLLSS